MPNLLKRILRRLQRPVAPPAPDFSDEIAFWDTELSMKGEYAEWMRYRTNPEQQYKNYPWELHPLIVKLVTSLGHIPRVLDVGSGPVSILAHGAHQGWFELVAADPLADELHNPGHGDH